MIKRFILNIIDRLIGVKNNCYNCRHSLVARESQKNTVVAVTLLVTERQHVILNHNSGAK